MKRLILIALTLAFVTSQPFAQPPSQPQTGSRSADRTAPIRSMLDTYCVTCHSVAAKAGGVAFAGIFDILMRPAPELSTEERAEVKKVARLLLIRLKELLVLNWRQKSSALSQLRLTIEDVLDGGLPRAFDKPLYQQKCTAVFEHVFESYPERNAGVYAPLDRL